MLGIKLGKVKKPVMSLREKQYITRWNLIHNTTVDLVEKHGLSITVNQISEQLGISARTFFNYFPTKEDAVLGVRPVAITDEQKENYLNGKAPYEGNILKATSKLYFEVLYNASDLVNLPKISKLVRKYPALLQQRFLNIHNCEELIDDVLKERMLILSDTKELSNEDLKDAKYILSLISSCGRKYLRELRSGVLEDISYEDSKKYFSQILDELLETARKYS